MVIKIQLECLHLYIKNAIKLLLIRKTLIEEMNIVLDAVKSQYALLSRFRRR
jgi:hypothetical protein